MMKKYEDYIICGAIVAMVLFWIVGIVVGWF
jgi:hypothetical protein